MDQKTREFTKIDSVQDINDFDKDNHIVILPKEVKNMNVAVDVYSKVSGFYVEYFHWNKNGFQMV